MVTIISVALTSLLGLTSFSLGSSSLVKQTEQANIILEQTLEQVRNFRDGTNWNVDGLGALALNTDFYPQQTGSPPKWQLVSGTETNGIFESRIFLGEVIRDSDDNIVEGVGTVDPDIKKVTAIVSWKEKGRTHGIELVTFLTNWKR